MKQDLILGSYVPLTEKDGNLPGTLQLALNEGATTFMFYTGAPQNTKRRSTADLQIPEFQAAIKNSVIDLNTVCIHAPYVINLANSINLATWNFGIDFLKQELNRAAAIGIKIVNLHPGAAVGANSQTALDQLVKGLNEVIKTKPANLKIALETMAGKGTEVGINFDQLSYVISNVDDNNDLGVCIDTCHLYDAGYDIKDHWSEVKTEFDQKIGLDKLFCMHINDSKFGLNSHKDRHANIGYGYIGFDALHRIVFDEQLKAVPKYLETPYIGENAPYKTEIAMLKENKFVPFIEAFEK